jgi:hypothetical protein
LRVAACTVVAVVVFSAEALAQPPAHANGKAHAFGHARHDFAANDFKIGLALAVPAPKELPSRRDTPTVHVELPSQPQPRKSASQAPECIRR